VIHSLFIPNFRLKRDAVPGRFTIAWFKAVQEGKFPIYCAEYCGTDHSVMRAECFIQSKEEFDKWMVIAADIDKMPKLLGKTSIEKGEYLFKAKGCTSCHSMDGTPNKGPNLVGIYGKQEMLESGDSVLVDENYMRESIEYPSAKIVKGFLQVNMPPFKGMMSDKELGYLVEYLRSSSK
jgi:cytochrome c oxidase subunit 2